MLTYDYKCEQCDNLQERRVEFRVRDHQRCVCGLRLVRQMVAPKIRAMLGTPDQFTADALGIPLKELPSGLKTK